MKRSIITKNLPGSTCKVLLFALFCMNPSCAQYKETYHNPDRRCSPESQLSLTAKISCEAFIDFHCPRALTSDRQTLAEDRKVRVFVRPVEGPSAPAVGDLYAHVKPFPIFVKNGSPWDTLHTDVSRILTRQGYTLVEQPGDAQYLVEADFVLLDVRSQPGGFTDLKGTTKAKAAFNIVFLSTGNKPVWHGEFSGESQIDVTYFYLEDSAKTLGDAYCNALDDFSKAARNEEFEVNAH